jgi:hypothetical protein
MSELDDLRIEGSASVSWPEADEHPPEDKPEDEESREEAEE